MIFRMHPLRRGLMEVLTRVSYCSQRSVADQLFSLHICGLPIDKNRTAVNQY